MASLNGHFSLLRTRIEPDPARAVKAQEIAEKVREHLQKHPEFATETPHTRLSGSYARRTAVTNIKDVDILVFAAQSWRLKTIKELLDSLHTALKDLPETLGEGTVYELRRQRRSINVELSESEMSLDIVPVLKTTNSHSDVLEIPDREWDEWVYTHPLGYGDLLSAVNKNNGDKVVRQIKLIKHWRDVQFSYMKPKSYWLESAVVQHIRRGWVETDGQGDDAIFADFLDSLYDKFAPIKDNTAEDTPFIPDAKQRNPVAWNWKRTHFNTFMTRLDESRKKARKAIDTTDKETAVNFWKEVFGDSWFPSTAEVDDANKATKAQMESYRTNQSSVYIATGAAAGQVFLEKPAEARTVVSPPKRFFGAEQ